MLEDYLRKIYDGFDVSDEIEPTAWREVLRIINTGAVQGLTEGNFIPTHHEGFLSALRHSNEVFSAFIFQTASVFVLALGGVFLLLSFFVARPYCRFVCPTGTLFKIAERR